MNPHDFMKTVTIPIKIVDGKVEYYYDNKAKLIDLENLRYGELTVPKSYFGNKDIIKRLMKEEIVSFLPKNTKLYAQVRTDNFKKLSQEVKNMTYSIKGEKGFSIEGRLVEIVLQEDLKLLLRGSKKARLEPCKCKIPILSDDKIEAMSINQAYTLISQKVEPSRHSHSGNVFNKIYYLENDMCKK
jgi:hypothetical protein